MGKGTKLFFALFVVIALLIGMTFRFFFPTITLNELAAFDWCEVQVGEFVFINLNDEDIQKLKSCFSEAEEVSYLENIGKYEKNVNIIVYYDNCEKEERISFMKKNQGVRHIAAGGVTYHGCDDNFFDYILHLN